MAANPITQSVELVGELTSLNQELCKRDAQMAQEHLKRAALWGVACHASLTALLAVAVILVGINVYVATENIVVTTVSTLAVGVLLVGLFGGLLWYSLSGLTLKQTLLYQAWKGEGRDELPSGDA